MKITLKSDRELIKKNNEAYRKLIEVGLLPQGYNFEKKHVCVLKRENKYMNNQRTEVYYFDSWLDAADRLITNSIV